MRELSTIRHRIAVSDGAQLLTVGQVRKRYSASDRWIARRLADENFPKPIKFGPGISAPSRWRRDAGLVWEAAREVQINSGSSRSGRAAYPFSSRLIVSKDKHYVYRLFRSPDKITDKNLNDAVRVMFAMAHHSSFAGNPGWDDRYAYAKLHFYSSVTRLRHADWTKMAFEMLKKVVEKLFEKKDEASEADDEPQADTTELSV